MGLSLLLLALVLFGASQGALKISFDALFDEEYRDIWLNIRLPRVLLAVLVGAALATAGVIMQGLFRNPMADPGLLGVSSGSALMVGVAIVLPFSFPVVLVLYEQMVFAIAGSLVVCTIIFLITQRHRDGSMMQLLLAGIAINALCGAAIGILSYIGDEQQLRQLTLWMMGNLGQAQWPTLLVASSFILPAIIATTCLAGTLNLLQLGDEEAHYLGVNVKRKRQQLLLVSSLLVGAAVSVSGIIGFIGLVIPHLIRMTTGANHRWLIPCSALAGACLLLMADTLARTLVQPAEMPVGLLIQPAWWPLFYVVDSAQPEDHMISAQNLVYSLQGRRLTDNVSLTFPGGEIVAILGPNGAGKSTLLRQLTGYLQPDSGECRLFNKPLNEWSITELAKHRAVMRQNSHMAFPFSVQEVIQMGRHPHRTGNQDNETAQIMALCDCQALANRDYRQLSGGEQQRVQLARLLVQLWEPTPSPKWLFLDEPTSALDIHHQQHLFRLLRQLVHERQFNVCCVLHDLNLAARYADRVVLMQKGKVIANGKPQDVLTQQALTMLYGADITVLKDPANHSPLIVLDH